MIPIPAVYVHNLDPFLVEFSKGIGIRWYGLSYLIGFLAVYLVARGLAKRNRSPLTKELAADFVFAVALGTVIGGRLGYCIFYSPSLLTEFSAGFPFWGVLRINDGGMASHGGMIGICIAAWWFARRHKIPLLHLLDISCVGGSVGVFLGRIANFINGELVGRVCAEGAALSASCVKFPQDLYRMLAETSERLLPLGVAAEKFGVSQSRWAEMISGSQTSPRDWRGVEGVIDSILAAIQSGRDEISVLVEPVLSPRYPSQLFESVLEGLALFLLLLFVWRRPRKPGLIFSLFLMLYPVARIIGEQFREPDLQIGFQAFGLTRGQILSGIMFLAGAVFVAFWRKRNSAKL